MFYASLKRQLKLLKMSRPALADLALLRQRLEQYMAIRPAVRKAGRVSLIYTDGTPSLRFSLMRQLPILTSILVVGLLAGTVAAAHSSLPNQPLYPIKLASEQIQLLATPSVTGKIRAHLKFADRRIAEAKSLLEQGQAEQVISSTLSRYETEIKTATGLLPQIAASSGSEQVAMVTETSYKFTQQQKILAELPSAMAPDNLAPVTAIGDKKSAVGEKDRITYLTSEQMPIQQSAASAQQTLAESGTKLRELYPEIARETGVIPEAASRPVAGSAPVEPTQGAKPVGESAPISSPRAGVSEPVLPRADGDEIITGVMKYSELEGGCWYLITYDAKGYISQKYELLGQDIDKLKQVGLEIKIKGQIAKEVATICQVGTPFRVSEILEISKPNEVKAD